MKRRQLRDLLTPPALAAISAVLLLWGLSEKYLWQDEASTAVLAVRLMRFGKPLAYDGLNLVTIDHFPVQDARAIAEGTHDPAAAVRYYVERGDYRPDTTWKWQPWGQFVVAAAGISILGQTTLGARLPFALAGIATVLLVYSLARRYLGGTLVAAAAGFLLVTNPYWILHARQCRYCALSSLSLTLVFWTYVRWQSALRWGAPLFVAAVWCWFQVDFGTLWPVLALLFADALITRRRRPLEIIVVGSLVALTIGPFAIYYQLWGRLQPQVGSWSERFTINLFNINEFVAPIAVLIAAGAMAFLRRRCLPTFERCLLAIACATPVALAVWIPTVTPESFLRYAVMAAPAGAMASAWLVVRVSKGRIGPMVAGMALFIVTPWASWPLRPVIKPPSWYKPQLFPRPELAVLQREVFGHRADPNRIVVEWLRRNSAPSDEILINYEDVPLMYYLPNPIRGGIAAFRAEDDRVIAPRYLILRRSVPFVTWRVFVREANKYEWRKVESNAPDVIWGNNPDPLAEAAYTAAHHRLILARRPEVLAEPNILRPADGGILAAGKP